jgi:TDG/mug DNA glycosylase family protein
MTADEDMELLRHGVGVTNLVDRPTRAAAELTREELHEGAAALEALVRRLAPRLVAMVGITAWRLAFDRPRAQIGLQDETFGGRPVWVLPNPSGLNAHHQVPDLARLYGEARAYAEEHA